MNERDEKQKAVPEAVKKKLAEMNLLDDFLFGSVVTYPEIGERFVKILLKTIFGREFKRLSVTAQKVFYGADTNRHGARLDVYLEPEEGEGLEERAAVYDVEPDQRDNASDIRALPRRMRFYHGKIAARNLNSGADYNKLKDVVVIMIMPYDPFGQDRMVYTVKNKCVEEPGMVYEDGASTLFLYTKGTKGVPDNALKQLLHYMEDSTYENAVNEELREIHRMVEHVKRDPEVGGMRIQLVEDVVKLSEEVAILSDEKSKMISEIERMSEEKARISEEKVKISEENARMSEENARMSEEKVRMSEENMRISRENARMADEILRLREELERRSAGEKAVVDENNS